MVSLRTQIIKIIAISFITVAIAGTVWVILESRVQQEQKLFLEGSELAVSAPSQAQLLVPGLLVPELYGSVPLQFTEIKRLEKLTTVQIEKSDSEFINPTNASKCHRLENGTLICVNRSEHLVTTVTPIMDVNKMLGFLVKEKTVVAEELQTALIFPLIALITGFSSAFLVIAIWISRFLKNDVRQPLLNLKDILVPVLENKKGVQFPKFRVSEVQDLATQMGQLVKEFEERRVNSTIADTTRSLAHDLKRPMVIIKTGLEMIERATDPEQVKRLAASLQTDVDQALFEANDIVDTTMEFAERQLAQIPTSPEFLISNTLNNIFRLYPMATIPIIYDLNHSRDVNVDVGMALRVFANIVSNAVEAMRGKGSLWFKTADVASKRPRFVEFCIENSNSSISKDDISNIFDAFYTKGKPNGRGLGLAIAQKIVTDHGGKIWCVSLPKTGVEFHFTLPISTESAPKSDVKLPTHSHQIGNAFQMAEEDKELTAYHKSNENDNRAFLINFVRDSGKKFVVQIIDNEPIYFQAFLTLINREPELANCIEFYTAENSEDALRKAERNTPLLIICDYDMGENSLNGLEISTQLRRSGNEAFICLHSALSFTKNEVRAAGADYFLPKPMGTPNLMALAAMAIKHFYVQSPGPVKKGRSK